MDLIQFLIDFCEIHRLRGPRLNRDPSAGHGDESNEPLAFTFVQTGWVEAPDATAAAAIIQQAFTPLIARPRTHRRARKSRGRRREIAAESAERWVGLTVRICGAGKAKPPRSQEQERNNAAGRGHALHNYSPKTLTQHKKEQPVIRRTELPPRGSDISFLFFFAPQRCATPKKKKRADSKKKNLFKATV